MNAKTISPKFHYHCIDCGAIYDNTKVRYLCAACESKNNPLTPPCGVLKVVYNYAKIPGDFNQLKQKQFLDLLPINNLSSLPNLKIGNTPMYLIHNLDRSEASPKLFLKDDSQNPTFSFKDRASALVSAFAKENDIKEIIVASTGNAGSSMAGICASQQQKAIVIVPEKAPPAKLVQSMMYGAKLIPIKGTYDDAFELSIQATKKLGCYNRNTAFNPLTIEGKKTVSFEIFEQMGFEVPDRIFVPVGDGVILSGVYKGFEDLLKLKIIKKIPVLVAVQSEGSDNLIRNLDKEEFQIKQSSTIADSISVDVPRNFHMAKQYINKYEGECITVKDEQILDASSRLAKNTGLFAEPAAATAFAGYLAYLEKSILEPNSTNLVLLTGSGLKDLAGPEKLIKNVVPINPDLVELQRALA